VVVDTKFCAASYPAWHSLPEDTPEPLTEDPSPTKPTQRSPGPENEAKSLQKGKAIIKRASSTTSAAKTNHIDKKGKVEWLGRAGPVTGVLRKVQKQELGTVAEVEKEVEHEAKSPRSCCMEEARQKERIVQW